MLLLFTKFLEGVHKSNMRDDIHPEEPPHYEELVEGCPEEQIEDVNFTCVL